MVLSLKSWFTIFNAIDATTTARVPNLGAEHPEHANSIILEIVGAATPSWTLDIQGSTNDLSNYTAVDYIQIWQAGVAALANAQLSITDTTRRFYLIPNCPPFLQLIATRTTGTLTVVGCYTSEVFNQWLLTTARGSIRIEGPDASDAAETANPVMIAGSVDDTSPAAAGEGDARRVRVTPEGNLIVELYKDNNAAGGDASGMFVQGPVANDGVSAGNPVKIGGEVDNNSPASAAEGDIRTIRSSAEGNLRVAITGANVEAGVYAAGDDLGGSVSALSVLAVPHTFNGTSFDRGRGVVQTSNYIAASLVSSTQNGADRTNYNFKGLAVLVDVTARNGTSTITIAVQLKDGNSNYASIYTAAAALSATGQARYLIYPTAENTEGWTETFNGALGARTYRVIATYGGSDTITFDVDLVELPN